MTADAQSAGGADTLYTRRTDLRGVGEDARAAVVGHGHIVAGAVGCAGVGVAAGRSIGIGYLGAVAVEAKAVDGEVAVFRGRDVGEVVERRANLLRLV